MLPLTAHLCKAATAKCDAQVEINAWRALALKAADQPLTKRGAENSWINAWRAAAGQSLPERRADDSWGSHKRRLTALLELSALLVNDRTAAEALLSNIRSLPGGFAGFQAPAFLRLADAVRACRLDEPGLREGILEDALSTAHHIQDYHFCARVTARCNALKRWQVTPLDGVGLTATIRRLAAAPSDAEFTADHVVGEEYGYRAKGDQHTLSVEEAQRADTLELLVDVFQRSAVEFLRVNPEYGISQKLQPNTLVRVPDPGIAPLLAIHLAARTFADDSLEDERATLIRTLVPVATVNPTALDTILSYLLMAAQPEDEDLLEDIVKEAGPVAFADVALPAGQMGPDSATRGGENGIP